PVGQTREYVKRVLTYYWMYSRRSGETAPTLDETASGQWPRYRSYSSPAPAANPQTAQPASAIVVSDARTAPQKSD
ncbi:MAG TPA: hypothetical protein VKB71_02440, partial [Rhizomicrobium sp.]|nr:hypothetical protein [Rhizomicrobium sp.]